MTAKLSAAARAYTPGPWKIGPVAKSIGRAIWRNDPRQDSNAEDFGNTGWARICTHVNHAPDALLISRAPALLEALKALHDDLAEYQKLNHIGGYENHAMRQARQVMEGLINYAE